MSFLLAATGTGSPFSGVTTDGVTILGNGLGVPLTAVTNQTGKNLISGGISWSGTGYVFDVSALSYTFDGIFYTAGPDQVTMAAADPTNNRFDAVVVDIDGLITVITGTASANPEFPTIPEDQLAVGYVLVEAASTAPTILTDNIYLDNTEWTTSTYTTGSGSLGTINFDSTLVPKQGTKVAQATATNLRLGMRFVRGTAIDIQQFAYVQIWVRADASIALTKSLTIRFENSLGTLVGNTINLFNFGIDRTAVGTWQLAVIPVTAFGSITTVKGLKAIMIGGTLASTASWSLDFMLLSGGILPQGALGPIYLSPSSTLYSSSAGTGATGVANSIFFGKRAAFQATLADNSIFLGNEAGFQATTSSDSVFIGTRSGYSANDAEQSVFLGINSGYGATSSSRSQIFGYEAGYEATDATNSNLFGYQAGYQATNAAFSNFVGTQAGSGAINAGNSSFIGYQSGFNADNAANSIFLGYRSGLNDTVDNTVSGTSILIGNSTSTGGFSNSIGLGEGATNTRTNQLMFGAGITRMHMALESYANDAAAGVAGLVAGDWYYNTTTPAVDIKQ